jgi:dipeptidyl aminopeptidase/acylaminoacyl peptidase
LAAGLILLQASLAAAGEPIVTSDLLRLRSVSSIDVASSGALAVAAVRSIERIEPTPGDKAAQQDDHDDDDPRWTMRPRYANRSHLYLFDLNRPDAPPRQLTFGPRNDHSPQISPDGRRIVFVRAADKDLGQKRDQVWIMASDGGEAQPLTDLKRGAASPQWSPDARLVLVTSPLRIHDLQGQPPWPTEVPAAGVIARDDGLNGDPDGPRAAIRQWLDENARHGSPIVINRLDYQDELALRESMTFGQLFIIDANEAAERADAAAAAFAARQITGDFFDHADAMFMPDGRGIVYAARKRIDIHPDRVLGADLWRIDVDGTNDKPLVLMEGWSLRSPRPSRDGAVVAFVGQKQDEPSFRQRQLGLASTLPDGPPPAWVTDEKNFDASVSAFDWATTGTGLIFTAPRRGGFPIMTINQGLLAPVAMVESIGDEPAGVHALGVGGGSVVYAATTVARPCVVFVRDARGERELLDLNPWVAQKELARPREMTITRTGETSGDLHVQAWVMEPTRRKPNVKHPLVLEIHGGPSAMWGPGELTMWHEFQLLCSRGFGVVYANPRGSGGYGYSFQKANFQNWGEGPAGDVLAAVDAAVAKHDWIDRNRLVVTGGSYGGYLTAWILTQDHRFKAAVAQRGVYDLRTFFGEGNAWQLVEWAFGGPPFDPRFKDIIERSSPSNFVQRIRTPLLIEHGSSDLRTGVSQSEMLYRAMKALNKPVEYVRYPGAGHDMSRSGDPTQRMDRLDRIMEFFERHIGPAGENASTGDR